MTLSKIYEILLEIEDKVLMEKVCDLYQKSLAKAFHGEPASTRYHHQRVGGLGKHVREVMNFSLNIYDGTCDSIRWRCKRDDIIIASLLHDANKVGLYEHINRGTIKWQRKKDVIEMDPTKCAMKFARQYGFKLSAHVINAIRYHHGGWTRLKSKYALWQDMTRMAILIHAADLMSCKYDQGRP